MLDLHIGAPKTGTNSVQRFLRAYEETLRKHGIWYPDEGRSAHKHDELLTEIRGTLGVGGRGLASLRALCQARPREHVFISEEALYRLPRSSIEKLKASLEGCGQVRILVWFRDYAGHVVSTYSQAAKLGRELESFDDFFDKYMASTSHAGTIRHWGEVFGWDHIVVRYYGKETMVGGDTVDDCLALLGLDRKKIEKEAGPVRGLKPNSSPGWEALEITRAVCAAMQAQTEIENHRRLSIELRAAIRRSVEAVVPEGTKVEYLSAAQRERCNAATLADIEYLNQRLETSKLPVPVFKKVAERKFMPSVAQVPAAMLAEAMANLALKLGKDLPDPKREKKQERRDRVIAPKAERKAMRQQRKRAAQDEQPQGQPPA